MEEAHIITGLIAQEGYTQEEAAKLWGRSKSWVSRRIKLLTDLDPKIIAIAAYAVKPCFLITVVLKKRPYHQRDLFKAVNSNATPLTMPIIS